MIGIIITFFAFVPCIYAGLNDDKNDCPGKGDLADLIWYKTNYQIILTFNIVIAVLVGALTLFYIAIKIGLCTRENAQNVRNPFFRPFCLCYGSCVECII